MVRNPEAKFTTKVNKLIDPVIYTEGMANPFRGGTPDRYYEGPRNRVLWVEYKFDAKVPATWDGMKRLTGLQRAWLKRAYEHEVNVCVIAGFGNQGVIMTYPKDWCSKQSREFLINRLITLDKIANYIGHQIL